MWTILNVPLLGFHIKSFNRSQHGKLVKRYSKMGSFPNFVLSRTLILQESFTELDFSPVLLKKIIMFVWCFKMKKN